MSCTHDKSDAAALTYATARLDAASVLSASCAATCTIRKPWGS